MVWRLPRAEYEAGKGAGNRRALRRLTGGSLPPGILAYDGGEAIGWCAVAPRAAYPYLERSRVLKPLDGQPVWSVSCLFVARAYRRQGLSVALLRAAVGFAREHGARIVEGYPVIPYSEKMPGPFAWTGTHSAFLAAGFVEAGRHSPKRPIMRWSVECLAKASRRRAEGDRKDAKGSGRRGRSSGGGRRGQAKGKGPSRV
jgi:GNAT superfamily N-acetyltransferase